MKSSSSGATKGVVLLIAFIVLALGGGAYWFLVRQPPPPPPAVVDAPPPAANPPPAESAAPTQRDGIVLFDNVETLETAFDPASKPVAKLQTGDRLAVMDEKSQPGKTAPEDRWYQVESEGKLAWVPQDKILVLNDHSLFDTFLVSTAPVRDLIHDDAYGTEPTESAKVVMLDSPDFLERCMHNSKSEVRLGVLTRLFYRVNREDLVGTWLRLLKTPAAPLAEFEPQMTALLQSEAVPSASDQFSKAYGTLPADARGRLFRETCLGVLATSDVFAAALNLAGRDKDKAVFNEFASCVERTLKGYKKDADKRDRFAAATGILDKPDLFKVLAADRRKTLMAALK